MVSDDLIRELNLVDLGVDHLSDVCYDTIDRDESLFDIFFCFSTRADASMCEVFLEFQWYILETCIIGKNDKKAKKLLTRRLIFLHSAFIYKILYPRGILLLSQNDDVRCPTKQRSSSSIVQENHGNDPMLITIEEDIMPIKNEK